MQSGDVEATSAVVWTRSDREAQLVVWWWPADVAGARAVRVAGSLASAESDFTAKAKLERLPPDTRIVYEVELHGRDGAVSDRVRGTLRTPPPEDARSPRDVLLAWSGDTVGQGFGIGAGAREMPAYEALLRAAPELFVHCGDAIYADDPVPASVSLHGGPLWQNVVMESKRRVAETLDDFRGAFLYPRHARVFREVSAHVPVVHVWDDHEVHDNWWPGQLLEDERYAERAVDVLAARARRAMFEHTPTLRPPEAPMYRSLRWGPHVELFLLDGRSFRTPNQPEPERERFFGDTQVAWLVEAMARSRATWKLVASDMPLALLLAERRKGGGFAWDGIANPGKGAAPAGREVEIAGLLGGLRARGVENVVWLTADVHYAAVHHLDPARARAAGGVADFSPFHELVAGPMHAGAFPRKELDPTFGPELAWASADVDTFGSPADGRQTFGLVRVEGATGTLHVSFVDAEGRTLHDLALRPTNGRL